MKNVFACLILFFVSLSAMSQTTEWKIKEVKDRDNSTVGYIYHTSAVGTLIGTRIEKYATGLRLVCSTKNSPNFVADPLIAIYWNTMNGIYMRDVEVSVDNKIPDTKLSGQWEADGALLLRTIPDSKNLMQALKTSHTIRLSWVGEDSFKRITVFDLKSFNLRAAEFSSLCKTEL
jgi:hypothetical protein